MLIKRVFITVIGRCHSGEYCRRTFRATLKAHALTNTSNVKLGSGWYYESFTKSFSRRQIVELNSKLIWGPGKASSKTIKIPDASS